MFYTQIKKIQSKKEEVFREEGNEKQKDSTMKDRKRVLSRMGVIGMLSALALTMSACGSQGTKATVPGSSVVSVPSTVSETVSAGNSGSSSVESSVSENPSNASSEEVSNSKMESVSSDTKESTASAGEKDSVSEELEVKGGDVPTTGQAKEALEMLTQKVLTTCGNEDMEGFKSLYYKSAEFTEAISNNYNVFREVLKADYPNWQYSIVYSEGNHFFGYVMNALTAGTYPDTRCIYNDLTLPFSFVNGEWLIDLSDENLKAMNAGVESLYPSAMNDAMNAGRNAVTFHKNANYSWLDTNIYIYGCVHAEVELLWQNEDGSLDFLLNIKNGTDEIRSINSVTVTATDDALGEIFSKTFGGDMIKPHSAKNYTLHIDASEVKTGTQTWGNVRNYCNATHS